MSFYCQYNQVCITAFFLVQLWFEQKLPTLKAVKYAKLECCLNLTSLLVNCWFAD